MKELTNKDGTVFYESDGVVKSFNEDTGYGFIFSIDDPDNDIYFHFSEVLLENKKDLKIGDKVEFIYRKHEKGLRAYSIKRINEIKK